MDGNAGKGTTQPWRWKPVLHWFLIFLLQVIVFIMFILSAHVSWIMVVGNSKFQIIFIQENSAVPKGMWKWKGVTCCYSILSLLSWIERSATGGQIHFRTGKIENNLSTFLCSMAVYLPPQSQHKNHNEGFWADSHRISARNLKTIIIDKRDASNNNKNISPQT